MKQPTEIVKVKFVSDHTAIWLSDIFSTMLPVSYLFYVLKITIIIRHKAHTKSALLSIQL